VVGRQTAPKQVAVAPSPRPAPAPSPAPVPAPEPAPAKPPERLTLSPVAFTDLPGWGDDDAAQVLPAMRRSCARLQALPADRALHPGEPQFGTAAAWQAPCAALPAKGDAAATRAYFERWFRPFRAAANDTPTGLFTGYYEAELKGARQRGGAYTVPLYRAPGDLVQVDLGQFADEFKGRTIAGRVDGGKLVRYPERAQIESGLLRDKGLELLWVDDPVDLFFLQVQGSGRVTLAEGGTIRVGFAGHNGHGFVAIGKLLLESGKMARDKVSMQAIRDWLRANPTEARALMNQNPRYIFFREIPAAEGDGPIGAQGVPLTPGRSLAVDRRFLPMGVPLWLDTTMPGATDKKLRRLMVAQDTGGAILGPVRGDFFWGTGEPALAEAGKMRSQGSYYLLLPKSAAAP
jgi:membrane-bound lytic murein transglycosylase A